MKTWELAVVGAGPAGVAAAAEAARLGVRPLLLDTHGCAGGTVRVAHEVRNIPFLDDAVAGEMVANHLTAFLHRWSVPVQRAQVTRVSPASGGLALETTEGNVFLASRVVLALGTEPIFPAVKGLVPSGRRFAGSAPAACSDGVPQRVVVIGGSDVAMDQARWLRARGARVEVLVRNKLRAPAWLVELAQRDGVFIRCGAQALQASEREGRLRLAVRQNGTVVNHWVDQVVAAVGRRPIVVAGTHTVIETHPERIRIAGDGTGRQARHVLAALGDGCVAAAELLAHPAGECR